MRQRGYNLVVLIMAITVLNIMVAISLPMWTSVIQRDREEELISRGFQYAEAIRLFNQRFQRPPVRLEELMEVKPRCIRRLWKDPITDGKFVPIHPDQQMQPNLPPPQDPGNGGRLNPDVPNPDSTDPGAFNPGATPQGPVSVGPIVGVRSSSTKKSFLVFTGKEHYNEWLFTLELLQQGRAGGGGGLGGQPGGQPGGQQQVLGPGAGVNLSTRWIGRPLPAFLQPPDGGLPNPTNTGKNPGLSPDGKPR
jgi:type II secretory pathway pseudopilin PulG